MNRMIGLADKAKSLGIKYLTVYALSTENLSRPKEEVEGLYNLIRKYFTKNVKDIIKRGCGVKIIGDLSPLPEDVQQTITSAVAECSKESQFWLVFAINYGSRSEIVNAVNRAVDEGRHVTDEQLSRLLYTGDLPDVDFIIRTGGEKRLSNFLMYQAAYAELYFSDVLFPDFSDDDFEKAIEEFSRRTRRFGKI
jgi:undecaprenyl diphosphate synthase